MVRSRPSLSIRARRRSLIGEGSRRNRSKTASMRCAPSSMTASTRGARRCFERAHLLDPSEPKYLLSLANMQGKIDAQENPLTNTVTYGVHKFHHYNTISNHFYISRPIFLHRPSFDGWPDDLNTTARTSSLFTMVPEVIASYVTVPEDCDKTVNGRSCKDMMDMACDCLPAAWRAACGTCCRPPGNGPGQACDPINNNQSRM